VEKSKRKLMTVKYLSHSLKEASGSEHEGFGFDFEEMHWDIDEKQKE
jgi:hypothetical protein